MTLFKTLSRAAGISLCVVALAGTAFADPGNGNGGPPATPPGQEKKAENQEAKEERKAAPTPATVVAPKAAAAAAPGQAKKAEKQAEPKPAKAATKPDKAESKPEKAESKPEKAESKPEKAESKPVKAASPSKGQSANAHHHVIVCHRTGSLSNPYVVINIPYTAWTNAHSPSTGAHPPKNGHSDILLKDPASRPGSKDGFTKAACGTSAQTAPVTPKSEEKKEQTKPAACPAGTTTTTERVLVGVWHATGAFKNGERKFVFITPSAGSAHYGKHADDRPVYETRTVTTTASGETCTTATPASQNVTPSNSSNSSNSSNVAQPVPVIALAPGKKLAPGAIGTLPAVTSVGGVLGAVSPELSPASTAADKKDRPAGGVLGAIASAPEAVAETATSGTLPFTGLPLWIAALLGMMLLAAGLVLRRGSA